MEVPRTNPREFIFPLFRASHDGKPEEFLGTCFLAHNSTTLVTAHHNVNERPGPFCIVDESRNCKMISATVVKINKSADLALLEVAEQRDREPLQVGDSDKLGVGTDIRTLEYSNTGIEGGWPILAPATRKGYASRLVRCLSYTGSTERWMFELSFPALRGASGAPVINEWDGQVYGVVVANVSYHLLPVQIEEILDERNEILEETKFMLPQGLAVPSNELRRLLGLS